MQLIGIDIGTTSICGISADAETGEVKKSVTMPNRAFIKTEKSYEKIQEPAVIIGTVSEILDKIIDKDTACIGISGQMHGILYFDCAGAAVSPLYTWQDERSAAEYKNGLSYAESIGCFTGYGLATDFYNGCNGLIPPAAVGLCTIGDYAAMRLCGLKRPLMHITNAASVGCYDIKSNRFNIDKSMLPELSADFVTVGKFKGIPVGIAVGDNQASFIGSVNDDDGLLVNVGTGAQISFLTDSYAQAEPLEIRPFDGRRRLAAGCSLCGGRAFSMVEKLFREIASLAGAEPSVSLYPQIDRLLHDKTDTELLADCRFCGTRSDPKIRGSLSNISEDDFTAADIALAVCGGMVDELLDMLPGGKKFGDIVGSGNGVRKNPALVRMAELKTGKPLKIPLCGEEAAFGAALTGAVGGGIFSDLSAAAKMIKYQ